MDTKEERLDAGLESKKMESKKKKMKRHLNRIDLDWKKRKVASVFM